MLTHPTPEGPQGVGGSKFQKSGKFHELPRKLIKKLPPVGNFRGSKNQKSGKCHELPRKVIKKCNPHPTGGLGGGNFKVTKHQVLTRISGMQISCAINTLQIFWAKPGRA